MERTPADRQSVRIALLDASVGETPAERNFRRELDADLTVFKSSDGALPPPVDDPSWAFDGVVISGSQTSVYDDEPWIADIELWVRRAIEAGVPVLGVCWGHQLIARAMGGQVTSMDRYELGYQSVRLLEDDDPLFSGFDETFLAFETHSDEVTAIPPEATPLATNDRSLQAFRIDNAWGVQFHPEYDEETVRWIVENKREDADSETLAAATETVTSENVTAARAATRVFENFVRFAATQAALASSR